jgi:hypothetical protein
MNDTPHDPSVPAGQDVPAMADAIANAPPVEPPAAPAAPVPPEPPKAPPPLQVTVGFHQGLVRVTFTSPINWLTMAPRDALYLATLIRARAEQLILDVEDGKR